MNIHPKPNVGTVELFQGREQMVIIISLVRSATSSQRYSGISGQAERINVAISRARAMVIIFGNPELMCANQHMKTILLRAIDNKNYIGCNISNILRNNRD